MSVQIIEIGGQKMAVLPMKDYSRLFELAEETADVLAAMSAERRRLEGEEYLPAAMVDRIHGCENPLRVWRQHRGLTLNQLATRVGMSISYLSDIERGSKKGPGPLWGKLARALEVTVEDILPDEKK